MRYKYVSPLHTAVLPPLHFTLSLLSLPAVNVLLDALEMTFDLRLLADDDPVPPLLSSVATLHDADGLMSSGSGRFTAVGWFTN